MAGTTGGIVERRRNSGVATSRAPVRRGSDPTIGGSILALVPEGRAGAAARRTATELAESVDGWITLAVPVERPAWQSARAAFGGHAIHPVALDRLAHVALVEHLDAVPSHVKTHGLLLRGPLGTALLARVAAAGHDAIVMPGCARLLPLRTWLRARSSVPICVSSSSAPPHRHRERRKRC